MQRKRSVISANSKKTRGESIDAATGYQINERGMARQGVDRQLTQYDEKGLADYLLHDRDGALAHERDRHRVGAHTVARGPECGVGRTPSSHLRM
jgi:hypothetical protein